MRVLMSCPGVIWGEPTAQSIHQEEFVRHLDAMGHEVTVVTRALNGKGLAMGAAGPTLVPVAGGEYRFARALFTLDTVRVLRELIEKEEFTLIHDRGYLGGGMGVRAARAAALPSVLQVDDNWPVTDHGAEPARKGVAGISSR